MINVKANLSHSEVGNEILVFDPGTEKAHLLDPVAGAVFLALSEGLHSSELPSRLEQRQLSHSSEAIQQAIASLREVNLLEENESLELDRRHFLKTGAMAAAGMVVMSVALPQPAMAQTCILAADCQITVCDSCQILPNPCERFCGTSYRYPAPVSDGVGACAAFPAGTRICPGTDQACFDQVFVGAPPNPSGAPSNVGCTSDTVGAHVDLSCPVARDNARVLGTECEYVCCGPT